MRTRLLISVLIVLALLIPGCWNRGPVGPQKSLRVLYLTIWSDGLNKEFHTICEEWSKQSGIQVQVEDVPLKDLSAKIGTLVEADSGADLAMFPAHLTIVHNKRLADVSDIVSEISNSLNNPYPVTEAMNKVDGRWVGIPIFSWSHVWTYREDLLKAKGLSIPDTWDEAATVAQKLNDTKAQVWGLGIGLGKDDDFAMFFQSLLWAQGGSVFGTDGRTVTLDSPATRAAVQWMLDRYKAGVIPPGALGWDGASNNQYFLSGKIAMTANSPTIYYVAKHQQPALAPNIVHSVYPKGPAGRFSYATSFSLAFLKSTQNRPEISSLVKFIMRRDNYERLIKAGEGSVNPLYTGINAMTLWGGDERLRPSLESLSIEKPVGWPGPVTRAAAEVFERRILTDMLGRIINDHLTVDQAVTEATKRVKEIVDRP
jgi:multiple sugar transport system substrate-binding protein